MSTSLTPFLIQNSDPGTRQWLSTNPLTYNVYVFQIDQVLDKSTGEWSSYVASWFTWANYWQTVYYGPRPPHAPNVIDGNPFATYDEAVAACQAVLSTLN